MINGVPLSAKGNRQWKVTTAPASEPVTVEELKTFARIDTSTEDSLLSGLITSVRQASELYCGRAFIEQTITLYFDFWPGAMAVPNSMYLAWGTSLMTELPLPPLISVTSISTLDEAGVATVYSSDNYFVRTDAEPGQVVIKNGATPPINTNRYFGGYKIIYKAGYGSAASDVPESIKLGIKLWATMIYENRLPINDPPWEVKTMLDPYRIMKL